jgi:hypothetical protein
VRPGAGVGGTDRVTINWPDGAIVNKWLQVTVQRFATRLPSADVFYFGNLAGETGDGPAGATTLSVTARDLALTRTALFSTAPVNNRFDFNRNGVVDVLDFTLARRSFLQRRALQLITAPA